jgi:hypothetical protein
MKSRTRSFSLAALAVVAMLTTPACARRAVGAEDASSWSQANSVEAQRATLETVFYRGNPMPDEPDAEERAEARARVDAAAEWERGLLQELYPDNDGLWALAIRDSDGDGIKDYRVSDYYGRFLEGDTDLDGDGRPNVLDLEPYVRDADAPKGSRKRVVPEHLSWRASGKPSEMVSIQDRLYRDYGILLVERSAEFTPGLARAVSDAIVRVHRKVIGRDGLPTLRLIVTEESSLLFADAEEGAGDFAQVFPATGTMEIYRRGIEAPPLVQLGFLSHEVSHAVQYGLDYGAHRREIVVDNEVKAPRFHALVAKYGWTRQPVEADPTTTFELFRPQYISSDAYEYVYRDESLAAWEEWLAAIYEEVGDANYLTDPRITELYVLGDYSISSPWEWYSDEVIARVYLDMFATLRPGCSEDDAAQLQATAEAEVLAPAWPYFRFENARGAPFQTYLQKEQPIRPADAKEMARHYIAGSERCLD